MNPEQIREVIRAEHAAMAAQAEDRMRAIVTNAVKETLIQLGISQADPIEFQKDMAHLRKWRLAVDGAAAKTALLAMGVVVTGTLGALWIGVKQVIGK